jgi:hypothetical protein
LPEKRRAQGLPRQHSGKENGHGAPASAAPPAIGAKRPLPAERPFPLRRQVVSAQLAMSIERLGLSAMGTPALFESKQAVLQIQRIANESKWQVQNHAAGLWLRRPCESSSIGSMTDSRPLPPCRRRYSLSGERAVAQTTALTSLPPALRS